MKRFYTFNFLVFFSMFCFAQQSCFTTGDTIKAHDFFRHSDFDQRWILSETKKTDIIPFAEINTGIITNHKPFHYNRAGVTVTKKISDKFRILLAPEFKETQLPYWLDNYENIQILPYGHHSFGNGKRMYSAEMNGELQWNTSKHVNFRFGNGNSFLGCGYRSLLLSDQSASAPYFQTNAQLNNLHYRLQYSLLRNNHISGKYYKYQVFHTLEWEIASKVSVGFFETIIWQERDSNKVRGFEWAYLNPVIFFRPLEFSIGSPDNMLMGLNIAWKVKPGTSVYGQLLLDEFFTDEIKNGFKHFLHPSDSSIPFGAWVNKQAVQLGIKSQKSFGIDNLNLLAEFNYARPYTYSHLYIAQNYSHAYQPLAHPYGANFREVVLKGEYSTNCWKIESIAIWKQWGLDTLGSHKGQNIFQSTFDTPMGFNTPVDYYGNKTAQGNRETTFRWRNTLFIQPLKENKNLEIFIGAMIIHRFVPETQTNSAIYVGIRWNVLNSPSAWMEAR